jgi:hypothetical protein
MCSLKRSFILALLALVVVSMAMGQSSGREMTIEESYLQESIELMIIRETSRGDSRDQKLIALEYIGEAINRGNTSKDITQALEYLSLEGVLNQSRENNRLINNYPDVRRQAARYLGQVGTEEAKNSLLKICQYDNEPMVLQEAVKSLGDIGINNNDEAVSRITWVVSRFDNLNPDNILAIATIDAFEKFAKNNNGVLHPEAIRLVMRISEGPYITPVKVRARQFLADLRGY